MVTGRDAVPVGDRRSSVYRKHQLGALPEYFEGWLQHLSWGFWFDNRPSNFYFAWIKIKLKDLLARMLIKDPNFRISAQECLDHPWVTSGRSFVVPIIDNDLLYNIVNFVNNTK